MSNFNKAMNKAKKGDIEAIITLIHMYESGLGVEKNFVEADRWAGVYNEIMEEGLNSFNSISASESMDSLYAPVPRKEARITFNTLGILFWGIVFSIGLLVFAHYSGIEVIRRTLETVWVVAASGFTVKRYVLPNLPRIVAEIRKSIGESEKGNRYDEQY